MVARERRVYQEEHRYDSYENRSMGDRCIMFSKSGPPVRSGAYNNNLMVFQTPGHVVILTEQARQARLIPIADTAKPPFAQLAGVSRGHWEGETLVIETTPVSRPGERGDQLELASGRTPDQTRFRHRRLRVHRHRPRGVHRAVYGHDAVPAHRRSDLRIRVPRRQHRAVRDSGRRAESRASGARAASLT